MEDLWSRYARIWSLEGPARAEEILACLSESVVYADPNAELEGHAAFTAYLDGFQRSFPGHSFVIRAVSAQRADSLARWDLLDPRGGAVFPGVSFGQADGAGRFIRLRGFFGLPEGFLG